MSTVNTTPTPAVTEEKNVASTDIEATEVLNALATDAADGKPVTKDVASAPSAPTTPKLIDVIVSDASPAVPAFIAVNKSATVGSINGGEAGGQRYHNCQGAR